MTTWREYYQKGKETWVIGFNQYRAYMRLAMDELLESKGFRKEMFKWFDIADYDYPFGNVVLFNGKVMGYSLDIFNEMSFDDVMEKIVKKYLDDCDNKEDIRAIVGDFRYVAKKYNLSIYLEKVN